MSKTSKEKAEEAKKNIQRIFRENPELKKVFKETLDSMSTPENVAKVAEDLTVGLNILNKIKDLALKDEELNSKA